MTKTIKGAPTCTHNPNHSSNNFEIIYRTRVMPLSPIRKHFQPFTDCSLFERCRNHIFTNTN